MRPPDISERIMNLHHALERLGEATDLIAQALRELHAMVDNEFLAQRRKVAETHRTQNLSRATMEAAVEEWDRADADPES